VAPVDLNEGFLETPQVAIFFQAIVYVLFLAFHAPNTAPDAVLPGQCVPDAENSEIDAFA